MDPRGVLVCPPDHFDVVDVKNPFMAGGQPVDRKLARAQWHALCDAFLDAGMELETIAPTRGCEDMVFTANQAFTGIDSSGKRVCLLSHMRHPSRRREVPAFSAWFADHGYHVADALPDGVLFEGGGDAIWHPKRREVWAGYGHRTERAAHAVIEEVFGVTVHPLRLVDERFYHLDTCLCALDESTALWFPRAFDDEGRALVRKGFATLIEVDEAEATGALACNAAAFPGRVVVIDRRAKSAQNKLSGYRVIAVDTGEFLKSGGSVFCLKQFLF